MTIKEKDFKLNFIEKDGSEMNDSKIRYVVFYFGAVLLARMSI